MSYPQMSGMYILNPAFLRLRSSLPPDVKDNSRTQVHACMLSCFSCVQLFATLWTVARQAPQSMGFSRQECWSGLPCPPPVIFLTQGSKPGFLHYRWILSHQRSPAEHVPPPNTAVTWSHPGWRAARSQGRGQEEETEREQVSKP